MYCLSGINILKNKQLCGKKFKFQEKHDQSCQCIHIILYFMKEAQNYSFFYYYYLKNFLAFDNALYNLSSKKQGM